MNLIEAKAIGMVYGEGEGRTVALNGISLKIKKGEFVAIMGPSGSGKSTLLHVLGFLDRNTSGEYRFDGQLMDELSEDELALVRNQKMGFIFQAFNLLGRESVFDNVALPLLYGGWRDEKIKEKTEEAIRAVGLEHRISHTPAELSGGEKQRVAIARAIVTEPMVVFADEPTGNLDSKSGQMVMEALDELNQQGRTVVLITHERYTAEYAERIIHLKDGSLLDDEPVQKRRRGEEFKK